MRRNFGSTMNENEPLVGQVVNGEVIASYSNTTDCPSGQHWNSWDNDGVRSLCAANPFIPIIKPDPVPLTNNNPMQDFYAQHKTMVLLGLAAAVYFMFKK